MAKKGETIASTDFPIYTIRMVTNRFFMVAGGGGSSKTGVHNTIEIFELHNNNGTCEARRALHHDVGNEAVMNSAVTSSDYGDGIIVAAGLSGHCQLYGLHYKVLTCSNTNIRNGDVKVRKRKSSFTQSHDHETAQKFMSFTVETLDKIKTDFDGLTGFQKVVQFTKDKSLMVTAGADGNFRVWSYPSLDKLYEVHAHNNEIDDMQISPSGSQITTVSRDGHAYVWNTKNGKKFTEICWLHRKSPKYRIRNCRYGIVSDKSNSVVLFTILIPSVRSRKPDPCFITKWDATSYKPLKTASTGTEELSALAISDQGEYLGVGTISGSVSVYISFSLQRLYHLRQAHNIFVTGLEFVSTCSESKILTGGHDLSLLSISVDNQIKLHQEPPRSLYSPLWVIIGFLFLTYLIMWGFSISGL